MMTDKEPWQMTQKEYIDYLKRTLTSEQLAEHPRAIKATPSMHRNRVDTAITSGNLIPAEVLADYPDLLTK